MLLIIGHIARAHGVRGEVAVHVRTDEPEARFVPGAVLTTEISSKVRTAPADGAPVPAGAVRFEVPKKLTIETVRPHQDKLLVTFEGILDRDEAEAMKGVLLCVDSSEVAPLDDPDEFRDHELVGLTVVDTAGEKLGEVLRIDHAAASDLIVLKRAQGGTALIPFVRQIVPTVDVAGGRVVVDPPEGLLDL
ncbi:ribosome maturation factor RimM [Catenuloplanes indicus]|uniref:Ribosome maturation factor RimM n=1 Tax=Catenuloplanes indicus TaxID=137267 RepID=A0AAE3W627_9ACTN|nr:ribosome maturation factor RimM [Catenuloplanes indicus]MDQ0369070.1 16S rRNA processing protein RimM [Catenuloplanes indicus]